jgi:DNA-binding MarR family transcriptional regulator
VDKNIAMRYVSACLSDRLSSADYRSLAEFRFQLRRFLAFSEEQAREVGLNPQQHQLLLLIRAAAPEAPTIGHLAERLILRHHSVVGLVDRLEQRGLVRRRRSPEDRRQARVSITRRGERILHRLALAHRAELRRARPQLIAALGRLTRPAPRASAGRRRARTGGT